MAWAPSSSTWAPRSRASWSEPDRVGHHRGHPGGQLVEVVGADLVGRQGQAVVHLGQDGVLLLEHHVELLAEDLGVEEVLDPESDPGRLVGVGRADAPLGGPQLVLAQVPLGQPVQLVVVGHDQVGVAADQQAARCRCPWPASVSTSASSTVGSTTTPLPMTGVMWS